ncbi:MAG TPA: 50S ribosomal protein L32 [Candidatus Saccharimonadales bacterium]
MGKPKKRTSSRRTGMRRSHLVLKLAKVVNGKSPVKALAKRKAAKKTAEAKPAAKPAAKKA